MGETSLGDMDIVHARAAEFMTDETFASWLVGVEPFLAGGKPLDVLRASGPEPLLRALDASEADAFS